MDKPREAYKEKQKKTKLGRVTKYFLNVLSHITEGLNDRLSQFEKDYATMKFGKKYFVTKEKETMIRDLVYYRNWLWVHVLNARAAGVSDSSTTIKQAMFHYNQLLDIETKSFVYIMKLVDPLYGLKKEERIAIEQESEKLLAE